MNITDYLNAKFPGLSLEPPLFYGWKTAIRFELGDPELFGIDGEHYLERVYVRAAELFKALHHPEDDIVLVADASFAKVSKGQAHKLNLYQRYIKNKKILRHIRMEMIPDDSDESDDASIAPPWYIHRYWLACKTGEIKYMPLIQAICNQDMALRPKMKHRVFFINLTQGTIFHIYDDRGCDVISVTPDTLREVYKKYNGWILEHDREAIDRVFNGKAE